MGVNGSPDSEDHYYHDRDSEREQGGFPSKGILEESVNPVDGKRQDGYEGHQSEIMSPQLFYVVHKC